jgi:hypothetical protein
MLTRRSTQDNPMSDSEATPSAPELPPFGWYPDPAGTAMLRWWDGRQWTERLERPRPEIQPAFGYSTRDLGRGLADAS